MRSLFPVAYAKLDDAGVKQQLRAQFSALCHDETPMVRRAAASNLGKIAKVVRAPPIDSCACKFVTLSLGARTGGT